MQNAVNDDASLVVEGKPSGKLEAAASGPSERSHV
jgi:hypothetical protein